MSTANFLRLAVVVAMGTVFTAEADAGLFSKRLKSQRSAKATQGKLVVKVNRSRLEAPGARRVVVDVAAQRAYLLVDGQVAVETPVSTARVGKNTPRGSFNITERVQSGKTSSIYGCAMPYWMRLDGSPYGLHVGELPGYPASAGCVRMPWSGARLMFENTGRGTRVEIVNSWVNPSTLVASR